jgi:peptide-methionine (S)-S-oxide reductase
VGFVGFVVFVVAASACASAGAVPAVVIPPPLIDESVAAKGEPRMAVFAGGCFWGIEAVFEHVRGVVLSTSGYAGGDAATATYEQVGTGRTRHAESVQVIYDASQITYGQLLRIFFSVAHDPTEINRQGPDDGPQYRSAIFTMNSDHERIAKAYIVQLDNSASFRAPIATTVSAFAGFYPAEDYHQDYLSKHPNEPYIVINDAPKIRALEKQFPANYRR